MPFEGQEKLTGDEFIELYVRYIYLMRTSYDLCSLLSAGKMIAMLLT